jgi:hypothetical protein
LKLTSLAVITLLVLGCSSAFAASGSFSWGFLSYTGGLQYCDYEVLSYSDPFIAGTHNLTTGCGFPIDGVMVGIKGTIPVSTGLPVTGAIYELADNTFDATYEAFSGCQIDWITKNKPQGSKKKPKFGWEFFFTCGGGGDYLGNYGYLTAHLGPASQHVGAQKSSFHAALANAKKR